MVAVFFFSSTAYFHFQTKPQNNLKLKGKEKHPDGILYSSIIFSLGNLKN